MLHHTTEQKNRLQLERDCEEKDYTVLIEEIQKKAYKEAKLHSEETISIFKAKLDAEKEN